jgi:plastocyanin
MPRHRGLRVAFSAGLVCLLLATTVGVAWADTFRVRGIFDGRYLWQPKARSIGVGDTIRWKAVEGNHNVKSRGANWSYFRNLPQGTSAARTFSRRGTFRYYCTIHGSVQNGVCSGMCGRIVVG